jgi:hypothetical protein
MRLQELEVEVETTNLDEAKVTSVTSHTKDFEEDLH